MADYDELLRQYQELQAKYDEIRKLQQQMAQAMEALAKRKPRKSRSTAKLTLIKGGMAAFGGVLLWLLSRARSRPALATGLTACVATIAGMAIWSAGTSPPRSTGALKLLPPSSAPVRGVDDDDVMSRSSPKGHGAMQNRGHAHYANPAPKPSGSRPGPQPSTPVPTPGRSRPAPSPSAPSPRPTPSRPPSPVGKHCVIKVNALGIKIKVCT